MFEDTLVESSGRVRMNKGRTVVVSALLHSGLIAALVLLPFVFTSQIEGARLTSFLVAPPPPPPPSFQPASAPTASTVRHAVASSAATAVAPGATIAPVEVPRDIAYIVDPSLSGSSVDGTRGGNRIGIPGGVDGPQSVQPYLVVPQPPEPPPPPLAAVTPPPSLPAIRPKEPARISGGAMAGYALFHPNPAYPPLARTAHVEGSVVLQAVITEDGSIKELKIISQSNPLLHSGVIETVKTWKYKPTLLSGEPVEIITTITINFTLGH